MALSQSCAAAAGRFAVLARISSSGVLTPLLPLLSMCCVTRRGLGANPESLKWFAESERVHARWAMLAVAGILGQVRRLGVLQGSKGSRAGQQVQRMQHR